MNKNVYIDKDGTIKCLENNTCMACLPYLERMAKNEVSPMCHNQQGLKNGRCGIGGLKP